MIKISIECDLPEDAQQEYLSYLCEQDIYFKKVFYFTATINQLQKMDFIGNYVEVDPLFDVLFHTFREENFEVEPDILDKILQASPFTEEDCEKLRKFYEAYHSDEWVNACQ